MKSIKILHKNPNDSAQLLALCPFNAIELTGDELSINAGCRMCGVCYKQRPDVFELSESDLVAAINKSEWRGIAVFAEQTGGEMHPVTFELIGKALELARKTDQPVYCLLAGYKNSDLAALLLEYGVNKVFSYDYAQLRHFNLEPYAAVFTDFIYKIKPSAVLVGGTVSGRSLAPRVAARCRTGLTADCTRLDIQPNTDIDQIRPAYGGNIMAHIHTPNHRPQFATVRYKIFSAPQKTKPVGEIINCKISESSLAAKVEILEIRSKEKVKHIEDADVLVVAGKAVKKQADLKIIYELAEAMGGMTACTRPLIEQGWFDPRLQVGLSGRTVSPSLIITCGVSGSVQFAAGMKGSTTILAINNDPAAPIFKLAHYAIHGDIYQVIPRLLEKIRERKNAYER